MSPDAKALVDFWFGPLDEDGAPNEATLRRWFDPPEGFDDDLSQRFGERVDDALEGDLDEWASTPRGRLALVLLLDQLTRNVHRGTSLSFAGDERALALVQEAIDSGDDRALLPIERCCFYLPLMHAEDLAAQDRCIEAYAALAEEPAPEVVREQARKSLAYARTHRDVIARFGRFPARNQALGRDTPDEERAFLERHPSGFADAEV